MIHAEIQSEDEITVNDRATADHVRGCRIAHGCTHPGSENTKYTYFKNTIKYSIIHNTQDPDFVFFVSFFYIYTRFLSYIYDNSESYYEL